MPMCERRLFQKTEPYAQCDEGGHERRKGNEAEGGEAQVRNRGALGDFCHGIGAGVSCGACAPALAASLGASTLAGVAVEVERLVPGECKREARGFTNALAQVGDLLREVCVDLLGLELYVGGGGCGECGRGRGVAPRPRRHSQRRLRRVRR